MACILTAIRGVDMNDREPSPEKRLLKIIEGQEDKPPAAGPIKEVRNKYFSLGSLKARLSFLKGNFKKGFTRSTGSVFELKTINFVLKICIFLAVVALGISLNMEITDLKNKGLLKRAEFTSANVGEIDAIASLLEPKDYYLDKVGKRDLFSLADEMARKKEAAFKEQAKQDRLSPIQEVTEGFKLVGISWSDKPDAIIEDTRLQKTYFVQRGHMINDVKIQAIFRDKIILRYGTEEIELR